MGRTVWVSLALGVVIGCASPFPIGDENADTQVDGPQPVWAPAFDTRDAGALSGAWGSSPHDIFVVGGNDRRGEVYHFDGASWREMRIPPVRLLVWVFGFAPDNVYAVGVAGKAIHYDGTAWTLLETGTTEDLWGIWGETPAEMWIVGGGFGPDDPTPDEPLLMRFDGRRFEGLPFPVNDRGAKALFKVWGIGSKVFAVGENGLIIQYNGTQWGQVPAGADANEDFISLWGTSEDNIVAVGGRNTARIALYDGQAWSTRLLSGVPGLNAVFPADAHQAVVGGQNGFVGLYDPGIPQSVATETSGTALCIHACWSARDGVTYCVGGRFSPPYRGFIVARREDGAIPDVRPPEPLDCRSDADCNEDELCGSNGRCTPP